MSWRTSGRWLLLVSSLVGQGSLHLRCLWLRTTFIAEHPGEELHEDAVLLGELGGAYLHFLFMELFMQIVIHDGMNMAIDLFLERDG